MPRPPDNYTHSQFTIIHSDNKGETVQCNHCKNWTGNSKTLNRKKDHLTRCPQYAEWRAQGNGQDLAPANTYNKRDSLALQEDPYESSPYAHPEQLTSAGPSYTPTMTRHRNYDISKAFDEFYDDSAAQKCMRVRCLSCGYVRAKNTTRQVEHLASCQEFLSSTEGQQAIASGDLQIQPSARGDIWRGGAPNPNLAGMINRRGPQKHPRSSLNSAPSQTPTRPPPLKPSLANHLMSRANDAVAAATQQSFLSHAGCGTLSPSALNQWLAQEIHISRALITFVGALIGKIRIPETSNLQADPTFRALDLLCSAVNNMKKELEFLESSKRKYELHVEMEEPKPATKGFVDLFAAAASPQSSLLEGLVVLWATEHCFCNSFQYASNFMSTMPSSSNYALPSYLTPGGHTTPGNPYSGGPPGNADQPHITALHDAFIQNWTSANFVRFVSACKSIVDEVANAQTTGNGRTEMQACERVFRQAIWLWGQIWPEVDGMGEDREGEGDVSGDKSTEEHDEVVNGGVNDRPIEIDDDAEGEATVDSPYGGTGLGAIAAHNQVGEPMDAERS
ncbi:hypothetical protein NU219Hw_g3203t1 [Hortaea werneckii]